MRIVSGFHVRQVLDELIAIPTGDAAAKMSGIISLNEVGKLLFEKLQSEQTEVTLVQALLDEYEVTREEAQADVREFLESLRGSGLLVE